MKTNTISIISVNEQNWREIKNQIDFVVSDFLEEQELNTVKFYTDIVIDYIRKRFKLIPNLNILISCWYKPDSNYNPLGFLSKEDIQKLTKYLNNKFMDTNGKNTYFYVWTLEVDNILETYVKAEFPLGTELKCEDIQYVKIRL